MTGIIWQNRGFLVRLLHLRKLYLSKRSLSCCVREKLKEIHKFMFNSEKDKEGEEEEILQKIYEISKRL